MKWSQGNDPWLQNHENLLFFVQWHVDLCVTHQRHSFLSEMSANFNVIDFEKLKDVTDNHCLRYVCRQRVCSEDIIDYKHQVWLLAGWKSFSKTDETNESASNIFATLNWKTSWHAYSSKFTARAPTATYFEALQRVATCGRILSLQLWPSMSQPQWLNSKYLKYGQSHPYPGNFCCSICSKYGNGGG